MPSERESEPQIADGEPEDARVAVHPVAEADAAVGRLAVRLSTEFVLRFVAEVSKRHQGDLLEGLILLTIITANSSHVDHDPKNPRQFVAIEDVHPDEISRPVSILAVSGSLGMPYETVRRYVNRLLKTGACVRVKGGLIVPAEWLHTQANYQSLRENMVSLRRFLGALKRGGIEPD
jgi:hypothetical protein